MKKPRDPDQDTGRKTKPRGLRISFPQLSFILPGLVFVLLSILLFFGYPWASFSDFGLLELQTRIFQETGSFDLIYKYSDLDPEFSLFSIPDHFLWVSESKIRFVTFPVLASIFAPLFFFDIGDGNLLLSLFAQAILFSLSLYLVILRFGSIFAGLIFCLGSILPIYVFVLHETILVLFLQSLALFLLKEEEEGVGWSIFSGFLMGILPLVRPEFLFSLPLGFFLTRSKSVCIRYGLGVVLGILGIFVFNQLYFGNLLGGRVMQNFSLNQTSDLGWEIFSRENRAHIWILLGLLLTKIPLYAIFILERIGSGFYFLYHRLVVPNKVGTGTGLSDSPGLGWAIFLISLGILFLSPNHGGQNTPRYFFCLIPFLVYYLSRRFPGFPLSRFRILFFPILGFAFLIPLYSSYREVLILSKTQIQVEGSIRALGDSPVVFRNPDLSYVFVKRASSSNQFLVRGERSLLVFQDILRSEDWREFHLMEIGWSKDLSEQEILKNSDTNLLAHFYKNWKLEPREVFPSGIPIQVYTFRKIP